MPKNASIVLLAITFYLVTMRLSLIILIWTLLMLNRLFAQSYLMIENVYTGQKIKAYPGSIISVYYKGYKHQTEHFKQSLLYVTDSSIVLGYQLLPFMKKNDSDNPETYKEIMLRDITAIRKISIGRTLLKTTLNISVIYGSFYILQNFLNREKLSTFQNFGITLGMSFGSTFIINSILNEKPKYKIKDGWKCYEQTDF